MLALKSCHLESFPYFDLVFWWSCALVRYWFRLICLNMSWCNNNMCYFSIRYQRMHCVDFGFVFSVRNVHFDLRCHWCWFVCPSFCCLSVWQCHQRLNAHWSRDAKLIWFKSEKGQQSLPLHIREQYTVIRKNNLISWFSGFSELKKF